MKKREVAIGMGAAALVVSIIFLLLLRWLGGASRSSAAEASAEEQIFPTSHLTACTADAETGLCYPPANNRRLTLDEEEFMATVREAAVFSRSSSSASSRASSRASFFTRSSGAASSRSPFLRSLPSRLSGSGTLRRETSAEDPNVADRRVTGSLRGHVVTASGSTANNRFLMGRSGSWTTGSGGYVATGTCHRGRSLLALVDPEDMTTGNDGWTFPVLIDGGCPVTGAMLKARGDGNGFGGPLNDF